MVDHAVGHADHTAASGTQSPAEVDFLVVREEAAVKPAHRLPVAHADEQGGTGGPEERDDGVVLPMVFLHHVEEAASAEGVAVPIDKSARPTGILKGVVCPLGPQFRLCRGHFGVSVHVGAQGAQPAFSGADVAVEQQVEIVAARGFLLDAPKGFVVAFGKSGVVGHLYETDRGEFLAQHLDRAVGGAVVGHDDFALRGAVGQDGGEKTAEHFDSIPVEDDDGYHEMVDWEISRPVV